MGFEIESFRWLPEHGQMWRGGEGRCSPRQGGLVGGGLGVEGGRASLISFKSNYQYGLLQKFLGVWGHAPHQLHLNWDSQHGPLQGP